MSTTIYLAGPLGFAEAGRLFHQQVVVPSLIERGFELLDPWALNDGPELAAALALTDLNQQRLALRPLNQRIGALNRQAIDRCDWIVANLDGVDVDSGTAAEIGYGYAVGKRIFGYRGDFRLSSDNLGSQVNLQVEYFIRESGGDIYHAWADLLAALEQAA